MRTGLAAIWLLVASTGGTGQESGEPFTRPLGFPLVTTTVVDVQKTLGAARVTESGHYEQVVCYVWPTSSPVVTFMSQKEGLSGRFTMRSISEPAPAECSVIPQSVSRRIKLEVGGLRLGMPRREFERLLGRVKPLPDGTVGATFERTEPIDRAKHPAATADTLYVTIVVGGRFSNGRLIELVVWKSMST